MLIFCMSHLQYQHLLREQVPRLLQENATRLKSFEGSLSKMWLMNLDPAIPLLGEYFPLVGRPVEHDPVCILRSLVLMTDQKVVGITTWVKKLRSDPILAVLSGFSRDNVPGVGTFYDFLNRFWLEDEEVQA